MTRPTALLVACVCAIGAVSVVCGDKPTTPPPIAKESLPERDKLPTQDQFDECGKRSREMALASRVPFANPPEIHSGDGELKTTLTVTYAHNRIGNDRVYLRSYNGFLVGPTLRVQPNDRLSIRLANDLPDEPRPKAEHSNDPPHGANTTNLHTHGLHASPEDNGDNPLMAVPPGARQDYSIKLGRANGPEVAPHPPGTHWYHSHKHGGAAVQIGSGMAGALIVEGGLDEVKEIKAARERVMVFQQIPYWNSEPAKPGTLEGAKGFMRVRDWSRHLDRFTTINGLLKPVIELAPGEVERWRFIHAGLSARLNLQLRSVADDTKVLNLHEIAIDGIATGRLHPRPEIDLTAGGSSDVLLKAPDEPGEYLLIKLTDPNAQLTSDPNNKLATPDDAVARVVVRGPKHPMNLPDPKSLAGLAPYAPIEKVDGKRSLELGRLGELKDGKMAYPEPPVWTFDKKTFDPARTDHDPTVGTAEEWTLTCNNQLHPFHIHVNAFQVVSHLGKDGKEKLSAEQLKTGVWRDTVLIDKGETIRLRMRFEDFPGKTVLHCHKMDHEDAGMMQVVRIQPAPGKAREAKGAVVPPRAAPAWKLKDAKGAVHELKEFAGRRVVLVFFRGAACPHCVEQLQALAKRRKDFEAAGINVVAISSDPVEATAKDKAEWPFLVLADGGHEVFKGYGCYDRQPMHGVFAIDAGGRIHWQKVSETPFTDLDKILEVGERLPSK